jgi:4-aminobutyrate aminotransferase/(S)-3-amino-2-methylpropionate transaminase
LNKLTPGTHEKRTVLFNSGAEAVENAIKVARLATGRDAVVAFDHAYHGRTNLTMALTAKAMPYKTNFGPFAPEVYRMPMSYPFREENPEITGAEAAKRAITAIEKQIGGDQVAAIIIEPIQGEGGFIVPAEGFLPALSAWAKEKGIVFIADEVQSGFCRTGEWFAVDHEGIVPDIITMAKGIAGGMPLSAITGRADLLDAVHPVASAGPTAATRWHAPPRWPPSVPMQEYDLNARAKHIEELSFGKLRELATELPGGAGGSVIGDIRGRGAMLAIELVQAGSKEPNPELTKAVAAACLKDGVIILTCGTYGNVIRLLPPLVISDELLLDGLEVLAAAIKANA